MITSRTGDVLINEDAALVRFGSEGAYYYYIPESVSILGGEFVVRGVAEGANSSMFQADSMVYIPSCFVSLPAGVFDNVTGNVASYVVKADGSAELRRSENISTIPSTITEIGESAFYGCTSLDVDFSTATSLTAIGAHAFEGCTGLRGVYMGSDKSYALTEIGAYAFATSGVSEIDLSGASNLTDFGNPYTFKDCKDLATVTLHANTNQIGVGAFMGCIALTQVKGVENTSFVSMGDGAFYGTSINALECFNPATVGKFVNAFNTYTVRFETYGLVDVAPIEVVQGDSLTSLPEEDKVGVPEGYTFLGWTSDKELTDIVTASDMPYKVEGNITIYAIYEYTVTFETGVDGVTVDPVTAKAGKAFPAPTDPVREGYTFAGWFTEEGGKGEEVDLASYNGGDITVYAKWEAVEPAPGV